MENRYYNQIRNKIRKALLEFDDIDGDEDVYDPEKIEDLKKANDERLRAGEERLSSLKKTLGISSHPDDEINQMMKRTQKNKIDNIEQDIEDTKKAEDELENIQNSLEKMSQQNKQFKSSFSKTNQTKSQTYSGDDMTNSGI